MVVYYPSACTFACQVHVRSTSRHTCNSILRVCLSNVANKQLVFRRTHQCQHKPFHRRVTYILDYSRNSNWLRYQHICDHIDEFPLWHIHQRCSEGARRIRLCSRPPYYKPGDNRYIDRSYK